ncbi:MAG: DUF1015 domain-containing protein [Peptococcaceae bacterium]|nr:DUF1015 domain-containing protein [Peptococcaceae bacterium]
MATIVPFKGIRYNPEKIENMAEVTTPPYDVIDTQAQDNYYKKNPYNIIRLEYGKALPEDSPANNRYTRAADMFKAWQSEAVLQADREPSIYLYQQEFFVDGKKILRTGFICAVKVEPYENGVVLPHEETLPKHKADRLELMKACKCNFSPVFSLYSDQDMLTNNLLHKSINNRQPDAVFTDENQETQRLWVINDRETISRIQETMKNKTVYIADGHHRYETALNYKNLASGSESKSNPLSDYVMMLLVNLYDPGLVVFPTHRLVKNISTKNSSSLISKLEDTFKLNEFDLLPDKSNFKDFLNTLKNLSPHVFGLYLESGKLYLAKIKDEKSLMELMPQEKSEAWRNLDVSVLHSLIFDRLLEIGPEQLAMGDYVTYTREEIGALKAVDKGEYQLAFFLNPTKVEEVTQVAANLEKMPQKSTYFYPKVTTGLVINPL